MRAAQKLLEWRKARGLSQRAAATQAGLTQNQWQSYEAGGSPRAAAMAALVKLTGGFVTLSDWLESDEERAVRRARFASKRVRKPKTGTGRKTKAAA